jgi:hypothetical protein
MVEEARDMKQKEKLRAEGEKRRERNRRAGERLGRSVSLLSALRASLYSITLGIWN